MIEDVRHPGWMVEVSIEELKVLPQAVPRGHPATEPIIVIYNAPASWTSVVRPQELTFGVIVKNVRPTLTQEAVFVQAILDISQARNAISEVVTQRQDPGTVPRIQQVEVTVKVVAVAPGRPIIHLETNNDVCKSELWILQPLMKTHRTVRIPASLLTLTPLSCPSPS